MTAEPMPMRTPNTSAGLSWHPAEDHARSTVDGYDRRNAIIETMALPEKAEIVLAGETPFVVLHSGDIDLWPHGVERLRKRESCGEATARRRLQASRDEIGQDAATDVECPGLQEGTPLPEACVLKSDQRPDSRLKRG